MATDKFRLQRLLELKEKHEQALAGRLGDAERQAMVERDSEEQIRVIRLASAAEMLSARDGRRVGELRPLATLMDRLDVHLESQRGRVQEAEQVVADAQRVLTEAHKARRILDKLRERHEDRTRLEAQQADQKTMDDIAMARFLRSDAKD